MIRYKHPGFQGCDPAPKPNTPSYTSAYELSQKGGQWLAEARGWMQTRFLNGSNVTWGSNDELLPRGGPITVADIEEVAAMAVAAALNERARRAILEQKAKS